MALYEHGTPFEYRHLEHDGNGAELAALWPMKRFPVLVDRGRTVLEASCIIEYLQLHHPGRHPLIPRTPMPRSTCRMLDRLLRPVHRHAAAEVRVRRAASRRGSRPVRRARGGGDAGHRLRMAGGAHGRAAPGPPARPSAWPTAAPRRSCSTPTGRIRSMRASRGCMRTGRACSRGPRSGARVESPPVPPLLPLGAPDRD